MNTYAWVYILTNKNNFVLYTGVTTDLRSRIFEHRRKHNPKSFTTKYNVDKLVFYEQFQDIEQAIRREKYIKGKVRTWKESLINKMNPAWVDISDRILSD